MAKTYRTKSGDTWDLIAFRQLGSCKHMNLLIEANPAHIDTAIFSAGVILCLPEIDQSDTVTTLPPWRK